MKLRFYLLDVSYEIHSGIPVILLWAIAEDDRRVLVLDRGFRPYFYAVLSEDAGEQEIVSRTKLLSRGDSPIIGVEITTRKYYGRPVRVAKITTVKPEAVREYREAVKKVKGVVDVLEADIRFSMRY